MSTNNSVYNFGRVKQLVSPHQDSDTWIITKTLIHNRLRCYLRCNSDVLPIAEFLSLSFRRLCLFVSTDFIDSGSASHMPPQTYIF